jgi:long-chain acyl-CoA synthetase
MDFGTETEASWVDLKNAAWAAASGLIKQNVKPGDGIAIIGGTGFDFLSIEIGAMAAAVVPFVVPADLPLDKILSAVLISRCSYFVVLDGPGIDSVEIADALAPLSHIFRGLKADSLRTSIPGPAAIPEDSQDDPDVEQRLNVLGPVCPGASFLFETPDGRPEVITLSHSNLMDTTAAVTAQLMADENDVWTTLNGFCTPFMRMASWFCAIASGGTFSFVPQGRATIESLYLIRPSFVICDEAMAGTLAQGIRSELDLLEGVRGKLTRWGFERTLDRISSRRESKGFRDNLADLSVEHLVRDITGGAMRTVLCEVDATSAGLATVVRNTLETAGISTWAVFGPVTASCFMTVSRPGQIKEGSIGRAMAESSVSVSEYGELVLNGYNSMQWPVNLLSLATKDFDSDNVLTGWNGTVDDEGFVFIDSPRLRGPQMHNQGEPTEKVTSNDSIESTEFVGPQKPPNA